MTMSMEYGLHVPEDPNITHYSTGHNVQKVTVNKNYIIVEDPMLEDFVVNEPIYYDLLTTASMFRSEGASQLCKSQEIATIPNTASMTRAWHMRGNHRIVEVTSDRINATDTQRLAYHLACDGDDQAHMAFSHASELAIQKWGGPENYHEQIWPRIAELGGTLDVLNKYGIKADKNILIPGVEIPKWINSSHPDVNVDRLQYAVTELLLWFDHDAAPPEIRQTVRRLCSLDNFEIEDDGQMIFKDEEIARLFAKGYLLLSTEHWNDPINRVQLYLLIHATQRAITQRRIDWMSDVDKNETRKPENYLMGIDQDFVDALETGPGKADDFTYAIRNTLYAGSMEERQRYIDYRMGQYASFLLDDKARNYPSEFLSPKRVDFGPPSSQVEVQVEPYEDGELLKETSLKIPTLNLNEEGITWRLSPLKNRFVDPLVKTPKGVKRLSQIDRNYARLLEEQQRIQKMGVVVRLAFAGGFEQAFKEGIKQNDEEFNRVKERTPMTEDQQRAVIEMAGRRATELAQESGTLELKNAA